MPVLKKWEKNLYEKQDFPDNYVDETFLKLLRKNGMCVIGIEYVV